MYIKNPKENTNKLLELTSTFGKVFGNKSIYKNQLYFFGMVPKYGNIEKIIFFPVL
jgi:hypothetical protein